MKLSISNIAWTNDFDKEIYQILFQNQFEGLEIAPTRIIPENPYQSIQDAKKISQELLKEYSLEICSMQSILFGKSDRLFGTKDEFKSLIDYVKQAIDFAKEIKCHNLVFGSPKNRIIDNPSQYSIAIDFFKELGDYAIENKTILSIEANPSIYGTNFINTTSEAIKLVNDVGSAGFMINLDLGTIIQNNENINDIKKHMNVINHIHISEPNLIPIQKRDIHQKLAQIVKENNYKNFISIEMKNTGNIDDVKWVIEYIKGVFNDD